MLTEYLFVSCDIVAHSAEPSIEMQVARVEGINQAIGAVLQRGNGDLVWASGGDGGHVAIPPGPNASEIALELILALRHWGNGAAAPLRVCGSVGPAKVVRGADGRAQLAGPGINTAGRLLPYGGARRVIVTDAFRNIVKGAVGDKFQFHQRLQIEPKNSPPLVAWLLSSHGQFDSTWQEPESTADAALLATAVNTGEALSGATPPRIEYVGCTRHPGPAFSRGHDLQREAQFPSQAHSG